MTRACPICGTAFPLLTARPHKTYCGAPCRDRAQKRRRKALRGYSLPAIPDPQPTSPWADGALNARLEELRDSGLTFRQIAKALGMTKNQVIGKAHRLGMIGKNAPRNVPPPSVVLFPDRGHCVYPIGDPGDDGFHFCGAAIRDGSPYCADHHRICYQRAPLPEAA